MCAGGGGVGFLHSVAGVGIWLRLAWPHPCVRPSPQSKRMGRTTRQIQCTICRHALNGNSSCQGACLPIYQPTSPTHRQVARVDADILAAVRAQSSSGGRARTDLGAAKATIEELFTKIRDIQRKAEQSELMVQEICRC